MNALCFSSIKLYSRADNTIILRAIHFALGTFQIFFLPKEMSHFLMFLHHHHTGPQMYLINIVIENQNIKYRLFRIICIACTFQLRWP